MPGAAALRRHIGLLPVVLPVVLLIVLLTAQPWAPPAAAQTLAPPTPQPRPAGTAPVVLVLDASGSMNADDGTGRTKLDTAKEALRQLVRELPDGAPVGLRVYGHRVPNTDMARGCQDTELVVPVGPLDRPALLSAIDSYQARGFTPIGTALQAAAADLPPEGPRTIVLVSDGVDTCAPPDPCAIAQDLVADPGVELRVEAIGFQVDPAAAAQLRCIAAATGGQFRNAEDAGELLRALRSYEVTGVEVQGGRSPGEAPVLSTGQYRDTIGVGEERWYALDLRPGQLLRAAATIVGDRDGPVSATARFGMQVRADDIIGVNICADDEVTRIGQEARQVSGDLLRVLEEGICQEPGRYLVRLRLDDPGFREPEESPLSGVAFDVELLINVVDGVLPVAEPTATPVDDRPEPRPAPPRRRATPAVAFLGAGALFGLLGVLGGAVIGRRVGP